MARQRDIIVHLTKVKDSTTLASARIARFLRSQLNIPWIVDDDHEAAVAKKDAIDGNIRRVYLVNGPPAFCTFREDLASIIRHCATVIWVQNDYTIYPPSQVNKVLRARGWVNDKGHTDPPNIWTTIPDRCRKPTDHYVNWNCLTFEPVEPESKTREKKLFYFGAYRNGREDSFSTYLPDNNSTVISTTARAKAKFEDLLPRAEVVGPVDNVIEECAKYRYGIYLHDKSSCARFMSLANRFYEMLSARMLIFVAENAVGTFEDAGYKVHDRFVVCNTVEVEIQRSFYNLNSEKYYRDVRLQQNNWFDQAYMEKTHLGTHIKKLRSKVR